jgi:protein TonB
MPRLRTTTALSLLALIVGAAGTGWLSTRTELWPAASSAALAAAKPPSTRAVQLASAQRPHAPRHPSARAVMRRAAWISPSAWDDQSVSAAPAAVSPLVPLSTPAIATPYERMRGHLEGSVLLLVTVDGHGRVRHAAIARSSGDPVLDAHALDLVKGWRFAVPADHPDGVSGELPMRFDTGAALARTP